jgi:hypothetical protein
MATVTFGGQTYNVYADLATADAYMNGQIGEAADAWRAGGEENKLRSLVSGTRAIDAQAWQGEKTDPDQPLDFPRTGLSYPDGSPVPSDAYPPEVVSASIELAAMLNAGQSIDPMAERQTTARRLKAGSVEIENFRQFGYVGIWPSAIMRLLGFWLTGTQGTGIGGSESFGTCGRSAFRHPQFKPARGF